MQLLQGMCCRQIVHVQLLLDILVLQQTEMLVRAIAMSVQVQTLINVQHARLTIVFGAQLGAMTIVLQEPQPVMGHAVLELCTMILNLTRSSRHSLMIKVPRL
jgi:hypothetical protein